MITLQNFSLEEEPTIQEHVEEYEYSEYESKEKNLNNPGRIEINIETQDVFLHPSESYLLVEGRLTKVNGTAYANTDAVSLTNNGIMHLFSNISYRLSGHEIESLFNPGQATTMLGLLKYPDDFSKSQGLNQCWYKDTATTATLADNAGINVRHNYIIKSPTTKGMFSFRIPLKHIFGFCEDYDKISYGMKHTLSLVRKSDDDAIFRLDAAGAGKVTLNKISWFVPQVFPNIELKTSLYKSIGQKKKFPLAYRMRQCESTVVPQAKDFSWLLSIKSSPERPRFIILGFQTEKDGDQKKNPSIFDHVDLNNAFIMLNSRKYPTVNYNLSFPNQQFSTAFGDAAAFRYKFHQMDELVSNPNITPSDYKTLFPLIVFDISKQSERMKNTTTDIQIKAQFNSNVPADTKAYAVVLSDKYIYLQSDGNKVSVVY